MKRAEELPKFEELRRQARERAENKAKERVQDLSPPRSIEVCLTCSFWSLVNSSSLTFTFTLTFFFAIGCTSDFFENFGSNIVALLPAAHYVAHVFIRSTLVLTPTSRFFLELT